jgi:predicted enzyme related to lactoylglutathione lyase
MADKTVRGRFVWHELLTPDTASAHRFYSSVVGWKTQPWDQDPSYVMFVASSGPLGGTGSLDSGEPHWIAYIGTDDIEETVEQAGALGARVSKTITEMPNGGKYALLIDPQGALFGVYSSASEPQPEKAAKRGEFSWHELATSDYRAAFDFYSAVFGWEPAGEHDMGPLGTYFMFGRSGKQIGGIFNRPAEHPGGPSWLSYVRVRDVQKAVKKAQSGRGTLINGPMEVPGGDWIAQFADPQGAVFAVHTVAADLKSGETESVPTREEESESLSPEVPQEAKSAVTTKAAPARKSSSKSSAKTAGTKAKKAAKSTKKSKASAKRSSKKAAGAKQTTKKASKKAAKKGARKATKQSRGSAKRRTAARTAKRPARKAGKAKRSGAKRSGGKKQAAKRARRAK